jgi:hypothetical protein
MAESTMYFVGYVWYESNMNVWIAHADGREAEKGVGLREQPCQVPGHYHNIKVSLPRLVITV